MSAASNTPGIPKGSVTLPEQYGVQVGRLWVAIDFKAEALYITVKTAKVARTEEIAGPTSGVLVDYTAKGEVVGVEVLG